MSQLNTTLSPVSMVDTPLSESSASSVSSASSTAPIVTPDVSATPDAPVPPETPVPQPLARQIANAGPQLERLLERATANGLPGLNASMEKALASASERPGFFGAGRAEYKDMEKAAHACDLTRLQKANIDAVQENGKSVINVPTPTQDQLTALKAVFGFNQFFRPSHIDRETYDKIIALDENTYRRSLEPYMDLDSLEAAILRLRDAKRHALDLQARGRVVDDWSTPMREGPTVFQQIEALAPPLRDERGERILRYHAGFFARDLLRLFA